MAHHKVRWHRLLGWRAWPPRTDGHWQRSHSPVAQSKGLLCGEFVTGAGSTKVLSALVVLRLLTSGETVEYGDVGCLDSGIFCSRPNSSSRVQL